MNMLDIHMEDFFDFIATMPDIEAVDEIDLRIKDVIVKRRASLKAKEPNEIREDLNLQEDTLRLRRKAILFRIEQRKWSRAVRAIFGDEGFTQCMEWIRAQPDGEVQDIASSRATVFKCKHDPSKLF